MISASFVRLPAAILAGLLAVTGARAQLAYDGYTPAQFDALTETTVVRSDHSVTGYFVTFRYVSDSAQQVRIKGEWGFTDAEHATLYTTAGFGPDEWRDGLFVRGPWPTSDMQKNADGIWAYTIPLPSGTFSYHFIVDGEKVLDANAIAYADGWAADDLIMSQVYVPFDGRYQSVDRSVEMPRPGTDKGSVEYVRFPSAGGRQDPVGIYLPHGFDAGRAEPYRLLILIHGGGGNYTDWLNQGAAVHILDNLIADGTTGPLILASVMNSGDVFSLEAARDYLLPYLEEHYNVSADPADRALGGLSRGGFWTSNFLFADPGAYRYYLIMSSGILTEDRWGLKAPLDADWDYGEDNLSVVRSRGILVSVGLQDGPFPYVLHMHKRFAEHDIPFINLFIDGGHQWDNWRQVLTFALSDFMWQKDSPD